MTDFVNQPDTLTATVPTFARHTPVMARHENGEMYPAKYRGVNKNTGQHIVQWDEGGDVENVDHVTPTLPLKLSNIHVGSEIEASWAEDEENWGTFGATVESISGNRLTVRWHSDNSKATINFSTVIAIYGDKRDPNHSAPDALAKAAAGDDNDKLVYLQNLWTELNREKFAGHMTMPRIRFFKNVAIQNMRGRGQWQSGVRTITMNRRCFNKAGAVYETFLHEMCHQAVSEIDRVRERINGGHGPHWIAWMKRVGLNPARYDATENTEYLDADEKLDLLHRQAAMTERKATDETAVPGTVVDLYRSAKDKTEQGVIACVAQNRKAVQWGGGQKVWAIWIPNQRRYRYAKLNELFIAEDQSLGKTDAAKLGVYQLARCEGHSVEHPMKNESASLTSHLLVILHSLTLHARGPDQAVGSIIPSLTLDDVRRTMRMNAIKASDELFTETILRLSRIGILVLVTGIDVQPNAFKIRNANRVKLTDKGMTYLTDKYNE